MKSRMGGRRKSILGKKATGWEEAWVVPGVKDSKVPVKRSRVEGREERQGQTKGLCVS